MKNNKKTFLLKKMDLKRKRVEFACFAGLCEGEATFGIDYRGKTKPKKSTVPEPPTSKISLVDEDGIHRFAKLVNKNVFSPKRKTATDKTVYTVHVGDRATQSYLLPKIYPWMGTRRKQQIKQNLNPLKPYAFWLKRQKRNAILKAKTKKQNLKNKANENVFKTLAMVFVSQFLVHCYTVTTSFQVLLYQHQTQLVLCADQGSLNLKPDSKGKKFHFHFKNLLMSKHKQADLTNIYFMFLNDLRQKEQKLRQTKNIDLERQDVLVKHLGGKDQDEIIFCTPEDHTKAYFYRFLVYRQKGDRVAYRMRKNQTVTGRERSLLAVAQNKKKRNLFWHPFWQREQGKKRGKKAGSLNTSEQNKQQRQLGLT